MGDRSIKWYTDSVNPDDDKVEGNGQKRSTKFLNAPIPTVHTFPQVKYDSDLIIVEFWERTMNLSIAQCSRFKVFKGPHWRLLFLKCIQICEIIFYATAHDIFLIWLDCIWFLGFRWRWNVNMNNGSTWICNSFIPCQITKIISCIRTVSTFVCLNGTFLSLSPLMFRIATYVCIYVNMYLQWLAHMHETRRDESKEAD